MGIMQQQHGQDKDEAEEGQERQGQEGQEAQAPQAEVAAVQRGRLPPEWGALLARRGWRGTALQQALQPSHQSRCRQAALHGPQAEGKEAALLRAHRLPVRHDYFAGRLLLAANAATWLVLRPRLGRSVMNNARACRCRPSAWLRSSAPRARPAESPSLASPTHTAASVPATARARTRPG